MDMRSFVEEFLRFESTAGEEEPAQRWLADRLDELGFETYVWTADADRLSEHPSFPDDPTVIDVADRPSVAGVREFGDPDAGPTLVLDGHVDVVPADAENWTQDPFEPVWGEGEVSEEGDADGRGETGETLTARGAVDMKSGLAACVFAATDIDDDGDLDGRVVVEGVAGEEEGGIGAAAAALDSPYPFERDAALVAEPTDLWVVTATEGSLMKRLHITGRSAHAATRWVGEDVIPRFEHIRAALMRLEARRSDEVTHPLYEAFPVPWPVNVGRVEAGNWASTVPSTLDAEVRIGVAPGETVAEVEAAFDAAVADVVADDDWLAEHPPTFERFSIQFKPGETDPDEPVVRALQAAMGETGLADTEPRGATYGADSRHYVEAGIPTVLFGPGTIEQAHFPDETVRWRDVERARETIAETARRFLAG